MAAPYRADHIGSFLRPPDLLSARKANVDENQLREIEDREILRVLAKQKELGFTIFTDGELRRRNFMSDFMDAVDGFDMGGAVGRMWTGEGAEAARVAGIVTKKLKQTGRLTGRELPFLKKHSPGAIKMTLPSPTQFPAISFQKGVTDKIYPNHSALLNDIVEITKGETKALADEGVAYIQIDAPRYSYYLDPKWREYLKTEIGTDLDKSLDEAVAADNAVFKAAKRTGVTLAIHLCRGNNRSHWYAEGGYDNIAEKLFGTLDVDRFLLEYDDARSGTFEPLRFVPKGKTVVLGLISSKLPALESIDMLKRRVNEATKYVPIENLALSPQCGFASVMEGNLLTEEEQWAKLKLTIDAAQQIFK
ncbi:MAG TPA: methionine synthase [Candidatus Binatia bacterium]|nr:methionine synthase [Candidatus Binatia bacterium]